MKKSVFLLILMFFIYLPNVDAITNVNIDRELTTDEYNNLKNLGLTDDDIIYLSESDFNDYKDFVVGEQVTVTKYFKDVEVYTPSGYSNIQTQEITEEEYNGSSDIVPLASSHETNYKKLTLTLSNHLTNPTARVAVAKLHWKKVPKVKSFDWFGFYLVDVMGITQASAIQKATEYIGNPNLACAGYMNTVTRNYEFDKLSTAWKHEEIIPLSYRGVAVAMQLYATVNVCNESEGGVGIVVVGQNVGYDFTLMGNIASYPNSTVTVNASYQHSQQRISSSDALKFKFNSGGYGGVFKFNNSTINGYFDNMKGVSATL